MTAKTCTVVSEGQQIVLPAGMTPKEAITWLERKEEEDNRDVAIVEQIDAYPWDGAYALMKALAQMFGWAGLIPTPGFFGSSHPPTMVTVEVGLGQTVQVPWGCMQVPGITGYLETGAQKKDGRLVFVLGGTVKQRHKKQVRELAALVRQLVAAESIYKGQAFRVDFGAGLTDGAPRFIDVRQVNPDALILPLKVQRIVQTALFTPIERTAECRAVGVPLKRGILLEGVYGTGKTLTAYVAAKKATEHGWTFIYLASVAQLREAVYFAQQYQPAVIFAEDIDRVLTGERTSDMDEILNVIDGIDTKHSEIMVVLTTNHVERINKAMLRPGRLDAVISIEPPDVEAVGRLIQTYAVDLLAPDDRHELEAVAGKLIGQIPAVIREVVERAKLAAVTHTPVGEPLVLRPADLDVAADSMLQHLELLKAPELHQEPLQHAVERLGKHLLNGQIETVTDRLESVEGQLADIAEKLDG